MDHLNKKPKRGTIRVSIKIPVIDAAWLRHRRLRVWRFVQKYSGRLPLVKKYPFVARLGWGMLALLMVLTLAIDVFGQRKTELSYQLSPKAQALVGRPNTLMAQSLRFDAKAGGYEYNKDYVPSQEVAGEIGGPKFSASFSLDPKEGTVVTDSVHQTSMTFKPKFNTGEPRKDQNRLIYPLVGRDVVKVYSLNATGLKEDIVLNSYQGDTQTFIYKLELPDGTEARMESDGSMAVYGVSPELLGSVSTGSDKDAQLLKKARQKSEKNNLLFTFPAPFVREVGKSTSKAKAWFSLKGDELTVHATNLQKASYPLSIDPTVYVATAAQFMRGNNETNIDFDVTNELIQKGKTTGARFDSWTSTLALPAARWNHATAVAGGYIYVVGGNDGSSNQSTVYWAKLSTDTSGSNQYQIVSTNPGDGTCTNWCTNSAYNLPNARLAHSMVAYNGFLYVIGGTDTTDTTNCSGTLNVCTTVYIAKLGANGEPSLWHPTDTNKANWVYWYSSTHTKERAYTAAVAYNNRLYVLGGQDDSNSGGVTTVEYTDILPTGDIGSWTSTGMVALTNTRYSHNVQVYNDRMYVIGGVSGTLSTANIKNTVQYIKLASDGTMSGSWTTTTPMGSVRMAFGGTFSTIWGGYLYVSGGCVSITTSGCTASTGIVGDTQLASINADGSITDWGTIAGVTSARMGYGLVAWRNTIYGIGGCTAQNTSGTCTTVATLTQYAPIKQDGEASTVSNSVPSGTSPCVTTAWIDCDMPPLGNGNGEGGRMSGGAVINNGFIYYIGGCQAVGNNSVCFTGAASKTSDTISYSAINADGTLTRTASCSGTFYGSWCVDNTNTINGSTGVAAFGYTVFNNIVYVIGGTTGTDWQSTVWRNPLNADGSLGTWSSQTFTNLDLGAAKGYQYVFARANPSSAGTYPGNLYVLGGCSGVTSADNGLDCSGVMYTEVYKCNIKTDGSLEETDANDCTTSGQLQIDSEPAEVNGTDTYPGNQGLGVMAGTVYANYIYLIGGQSPDESERGEVMYAKIDNSNNIVAVTSSTNACVNPSLIGSVWIPSCNELSPVRRRGVAFGYNGYLYALAGYNVSGGGSLNDLLFAKIDVSDGSIGTFTTSQVTVNARWDLRAIINNGYVYTFGGCSVGTPPASCTSTTGTIQTFQLYNNYSGSPAAYSTGNNVGADRIGGNSTIMNGYIYYAGGCTNIGCTAFTNTTYYASIGADGVIGSWSSGGTLGASLAWGKLVNAGDTLYYIGGQTGNANTTAVGTIYYSSSISSGNPTWSSATKGIEDTGSGAVARTKFGAAVWNNRIYITGGYNSSGTVQSTVYTSPQMTSGGNITTNWPSATTSFSVARAQHTTVAYANNLYVLGGYDGTNFLNDTQFTQINTDGTVDSWTYSTSLPGVIADAEGFAANGFMYLVGGRSAASTCAPNTLVAPISANTTVATGNNPTGLGEWYETNVKYQGDRYGAAAVYNQGKVYILGGGCSSLVSSSGGGSQWTYYSTLQAQPQVAKYSRMIDTDTDVFPTSWLLNGLDNSIGAHWTARYRTMHDLDDATLYQNPNEDCGTSLTMPVMTTWGQETNFGDVTLGTVNTYTPLNSSGGNINCARYYYFSVTIDASQTFGYPEDVSRGPTIADLSLFFTADPSRRLRHGKTFTGGEQQPYDTPCRVGASAPGDPNYHCPLP